jgi:hypothetical protein
MQEAIQAQQRDNEKLRLKSESQEKYLEQLEETH